MESGSKELHKERAFGSLSHPLKAGRGEATVYADFPLTKVI